MEQSPATIVMPTGTGKTETMLAALAAYGREPFLVVVPWDALRAQTAHKFLTFGLLKALGVLPQDVPNPVVG
ncbi:DEAD/DEAH box helicase family protein, partial [Pseudomonas umsongensis]|nr:DEAD/DEAH box helicase family protein [Pseudomonas umsongensis]